MTDASIVDALAATDLFGGMSRRALGRIADQCRTTTHVAGSVVTTEGDDGVGFHLIVRGTAAVDVHGTARPALGPGDYFGEISLIDGKPRSATVTATSELATIGLSAWAFSPILDSEPEVAKALLLKACERLRRVETV